MKRYSTERDDPPFEYDTGEYCLYEEAHLIEADRDIKATNLQRLVDAVIDYSDDKNLVELARSLKQ